MALDGQYRDLDLGEIAELELGGEKEIRAVLFDCFGVVLTELGSTWMKKHNFSEERRGEWKRVAHASNLGEMSETELYRLSGRMIGKNAGELEAEWGDMVGVNLEVVEVVRMVRGAGYKVGILSNATRMIREYLFRFDLEKEFDGVFVSSELRVGKPDPKAYEMAADGLGVNLEECLMIDDKEKCVVGAREAGMFGLKYDEKMDLADALRMMGVKI